uniref:Gypsy retrotransposon integrase-like protein 1 n=1 Tax=Cajanus cajan TaxID=3821 RepID=A0A151TYY6_CAJCA|nr:Gypsy retrotransposon integrase-like protein 1 [Cajanus cajan]
MKVNFQEALVKHIPREDNIRADQLVRLATTNKSGQLRTIIQQEIDHPSVEAEIVGSVVTDRTEADYVMQEVHEGICGMHSGARTTVSKLLRAGYYWLTMNTDCSTFVKKCQSCQKYDNLIHQLAEQLHYIPPAWPFATWGADILRPFPVAKGQCKFLIVAVDLFTKWIEAEPLASISAHQVQKFLWKNIITRFGIPSTLTNGQAESANKVILTELKKRLGEAKGAWAEQLPEVLWAYRCTPQLTTQETPFRLVYGSDAMLPVEIGEPSFRRAHFDESNNEDELRTNLDVVDEIRD